ncbi:MAG: circadian clock KaiB family protein [Polyangiaceae bacterium]|nr:circadian clock KaiB family protein [Polyangiaceae bacterium]
MNKYRFKLFVTDQTPRSEQAISNLRAICEAELKDMYEIVIVDVLDQPEAAEAEKILATPTLIKELPLPQRRIIGELSRGEEVLRRLGLAPRGAIVKEDP